MVISPAIEKIVNEQIREEFESAFIYLSMSSYFQSIDLPGFAHWMKIQYGEELEHGMKMFDYLVEREGSPVVPALKKPAGTWKSPVDAFDTAYKHEQHITECIYAIVKAARKEEDLATENFYQWFVEEQVEEEAQTIAILKQLKLIEGNGQALLSLDRHLAARNGD